MRFAFLEDGVAWGCSILSDLTSHWEKRNGTVIQEFNPANLDRARLAELLKQYDGKKLSSRWDELEWSVMSGLGTTVPKELDDFAACKIKRKADIANLFVPNFYFGCEPDDPTVTYAFAKANPFGAKLGTVLGSVPIW